MNNRVYVAVAYQHICVEENVQRFFEALYHWPEWYCEAFSVETMEEANLLARQKYMACLACCPTYFGHVPLSLPASGSYCIESSTPPPVQPVLPMLPSPDPVAAISPNSQGYPSTETQIPVAQSSPLIASGAWSVSYIMGYAVEEDLEKLIYLLMEKSYPHAMWWPRLEIARHWSLKCYVDRFCGQYDLRDIDLIRPNRLLNAGEQYTDPRLEEDSIKPSENAAFIKLRKCCLI